MKRRYGKRHSPEQIIRKLRDADAMLNSGKTVGKTCQALEISEQTFHRWRHQYGGMKAEEAKRLKAALAQGNNRHSTTGRRYAPSAVRPLALVLSFPSETGQLILQPFDSHLVPYKRKRVCRTSTAPTTPAKGHE